MLEIIIKQIYNPLRFPFMLWLPEILKYYIAQLKLLPYPSFWLNYIFCEYMISIFLFTYMLNWIIL